MPTARNLIPAVLILLSGCSSPTATVQLIDIGLAGLDAARTAQQQQHDQLTQHLDRQLTALDSAFDTDVKLVAAGQLKTPDGQPVDLTAEWVIQARRGYAAARSLVQQQRRHEQQAHASELDNLRAAEEALRMARTLSVMQWNVAERFKQTFLSLSNQKGTTPHE
jgi:hypothetical protein